MPRDWKYIETYLDNLASDVYAQPDDPQHETWAREVIERWVPRLPVMEVLDIGCGTGFCQSIFEEHSLNYTGIALGEDVSIGKKNGRNIFEMDMNFMTWEDNSFDLLFVRHALEHGSMPIITLLECHRIARMFLILVMPNPNYYGYVGRNHLSVMHRSQARWLLRRSGWKVEDSEYTEQELRYLCSKQPIISYEGWAKAPVDAEISELDIND